MKKYLFVSGDARQQFAAEYINKCGNETAFANTYTQLRALVKCADAIVLPLPVSRDRVHINSVSENGIITLEELLFLLEKGMTVYAGMPPFEFSQRAMSKGVRLYDYYKNEALAVMNSISTAEGVIYELIEAGNINIFGSKIAVFGYGKAASAISRRLIALGAQVTVFARSDKALTEAESDFCKAISLYSSESYTSDFDFVINTIPARVIEEDFLKNLPEHCFVLEIASAPYGIDFDAAQKLGVNVKIAPSLPGRISPKSAGEAIARTILKVEVN